VNGVFGKLADIPILRRILNHRFVKFGTVGFSGTLINLLVLYLNQEIVFRSVNPPETRLHLSLAGAIFVATLSNFIWNRTWTWEDRKGKTRHGVLVQLGRYYLASGAAIGIQFLFTILLSRLMHYVPANVLAILIAAVFTYVLNDIWTFAVRNKETFKGGKQEKSRGERHSRFMLRRDG